MKANIEGAMYGVSYIGCNVWSLTEFREWRLIYKVLIHSNVTSYVSSV